MLILKERENDRLFIGTDVTITITKIGGNYVSLGIDAPKGVRVIREGAGRVKPDADQPARRA